MRTRSSSLALLITIGLLIISACSVETTSSRDINARAIYRDYEVHYDEASNTIRTDADFTVGGPSGTHVDLDDNANVTAGGVQMKEESHYGKKYYLVQNLPASDAAETYVQQKIEYTNRDGKRSTQIVRLSRLVVRAVPPTLDITKDYVVAFEIPGEIQNGSEVELHIVQNQGNGFSQRFGRVPAVKTGEVSIPVSEFRYFLPKFPIDVYISLKSYYQTKDDASDKAVRIRSSYQAKRLKIPANF